MTIQRFEADQEGYIVVPLAIALLSFGMLNNKVMCWCLTDPLSKGGTKKFIVKKTGETVRPADIPGYITSICNDDVEFHIFQEQSEFASSRSNSAQILKPGDNPTKK